MMAKREAREEALRARRSLTADEVGSLSAGVLRNVLSLPEFGKAGVVTCYVSKADEVRTQEIIGEALSRDKKVLVPRAEPSSFGLAFCQIGSLDELRPGHFGVLEPPGGAPEVPLSEAGLVLVPVVAWDASGRRIGYGKGYFDRALKLRGRATSVGLAFESQLRRSLPAGRFDVPLDAVVTEKRVVRFAQGGGA